MEDVSRVVLAMSAPEVAEEVLHLLDRSGRARVVATAFDPGQLAAAVAQLEPDAVVAEPQLAPDGVAGPLFALAPRESVGSLRAAVAAGAQGYFVWPAERDGLLAAVTRARAATAVLERRALIVAVHAARGGAGCTFLATHLARSFAARDLPTTLLDLDRDYGDVAHVLGAPDDGVRTVADLAPVADELRPTHLREVLWHGAVLGPPASEAETVDDALLRRVVEVAAAGEGVVVLHLPRSLLPINAVVDRDRGPRPARRLARRACLPGHDPRDRPARDRRAADRGQPRGSRRDRHRRRAAGLRRRTVRGGGA